MTKIGLEIHSQLTKLESKLFCSCKANYREFEPNTNICPVCMGLPGSLPRLNQKAVEKATMIAMALNCHTPEKITFFRKNYFYPDLPKNFQITQLNIYGDTSVGGTGILMVGEKKIRITRIQLEEDPGRLIYESSSEKNQITLVDYNRAGTPLVEIVTEPDFENPKDFKKIFPAQFIAEGVDQTRAWFYYLHIIATAIKEAKDSAKGTAKQLKEQTINIATTTDSKDIHSFGLKVSNEGKDWDKESISGNEKKIYEIFQKRASEMVDSLRLQNP